jgi:hypothetical protein
MRHGCLPWKNELTSIICGEARFMVGEQGSLAEEGGLEEKILNI